MANRNLVTDVVLDVASFGFVFNTSCLNKDVSLSCILSSRFSLKGYNGLTFSTCYLIRNAENCFSVERFMGYFIESGKIYIPLQPPRLSNFSLDDMVFKDNVRWGNPIFFTSIADLHTDRTSFLIIFENRRFLSDFVISRDDSCIVVEKANGDRGYESFFSVVVWTSCAV